MKKALIDTGLETRKAIPKEVEALAEIQKVPIGATREETIGATEDRPRDRRLAVRRRGQLIRCAVPARRKGPKCSNGIRNIRKQEGIQQDHQAGSREASSRVFRQTASDWTLWRGRPSPKPKKIRQRKEEKAFRIEL